VRGDWLLVAGYMVGGLPAMEDPLLVHGERGTTIPVPLLGLDLGFEIPLPYAPSDFTFSSIPVRNPRCNHSILFFLQIVEVSDRRAVGRDYDDDHGGILLNPDPDLERGSSSHLRSLVIGGGD
jgi:hypothetical protein